MEELGAGRDRRPCPRPPVHLSGSHRYPLDPGCFARRRPSLPAARRLHARLIFAVAVLAVCPSCLSLIQPPRLCFSSAHSFRLVLPSLPFRQPQDILIFILWFFLAPCCDASTATSGPQLRPNLRLLSRCSRQLPLYTDPHPDPNGAPLFILTTHRPWFGRQLSPRLISIR